MATVAGGLVLGRCEVAEALVEELFWPSCAMSIGAAHRRVLGTKAGCT